MKKFLKISLITFGSLLALVIIAVAVVSWLVFTPARLTPIANRQASKYLNCGVNIKKADVSVVKFFSRFELEAEGLTLISPMKGSPRDTLLEVGSFSGRIDLIALLRRNELILSDLVLTDGSAFVFVDAEGNANYDIFPAAKEDLQETDADDDGFALTYIDLGHVTLKDVSVGYHDLEQGLRAEIDGLSADIEGALRGDNADAKVTAGMSGLVFTMAAGEDTGGIELTAGRVSADVRGKMYGEDADAVIKAEMSTVAFVMDSMSGNASGMELTANGTRRNRLYSGDVSAGFAGLLFAMGGEEFLRDADLRMDAKAEVGLEPSLSARFGELSLSLDGLALSAAGSVAVDADNDIHTDISYELDSWALKDIVALVPERYRHYLEDIRSIGGTVSSSGTVKGVYGTESMPLLNLQISLRDGSAEYAALPFPLGKINGDLSVFTDMKDDRISYVRIDGLGASTPGSDISVSGELRNLFTDMRARLSAKGNVSLGEMSPFIPDSMNVTATGRADLRIDADVRMSQLEKMELEKMKLAGSVTLTSLEASYDTISVSSALAKIDFSLPNRAPRDNHRKFAAADISADRIELAMGTGIKASLQTPRIAAELDDIRDTTRIPAIWIDAAFGHIDATADTISVDVASPAVNFSVAPQRRDAGQPRFSLTYGSGEIKGAMGADTFGAEKIDLAASVAYNEAEDNPLLKFRPRGRLDAQGLTASLQALGEPLEVPVLEMGITPRQFVIDQARVLYGKSDFYLDGILDNLIPFVQGDSILRGNFLFKSETVELEKILALTSGLGSDEEESKTYEASSGPYMVPKRVDAVLHADIKEALFLGKSIRNIKGDVNISDGNMVLDELTLELPGADAQLTALYKSPRKNHLYAGIDFHLLEVEIETLLQMIPDLDTIMPMLRSFAGKAEFHMAVETNLDSMYRLKMPTLLGEASIRGQDLVVMDSETFRKISRLLLFRDKKNNKIDSLSAEFTVIGSKIDVYPFLISMDRYKAVVGGRHNLDMTFDYSVSLVKSPLPFRLAVQIKSTPEKTRFRLKRSRYPKFYRPVARANVKNKQLELRQIIRQALIGSVAVKEDDEE